MENYSHWICSTSLLNQRHECFNDGENQIFIYWPNKPSHIDHIIVGKIKSEN